MGTIIISIAILVLIYFLLSKKRPSFTRVKPRNYKRNYEPTPSSYPLKKSKEILLDYGYLIKLLNGDQSAADRLMKSLKLEYPNKYQQWYIEKAISDVLRDRQ